MAQVHRIRAKHIDIQGDSLTISAPLTTAPAFSNTDGNTSYGTRALANLGGSLTGSNNTSVGDSSGVNLSGNTSNNTFFGYEAGFDLTTGNGNVLEGSQAGRGLTTAANNTVIGDMSGNSGQMGSSITDCVIIGHGGGASGIAGKNNTLIGSGIGPNLTAGINNTYIGTVVGTTSSDESGVIRIADSSSTIGYSKCFIGGISGVTTDSAAVACLVDSSGQLGVTSSLTELKHSLQLVNPVKAAEFLMKLPTKTFKFIKGHQGLNFGFTVEDVEGLCKDFFEDFVVRDHEGKPYSLAYHQLPPILVAGYQALGKRVEELENTVSKKLKRKLEDEIFGDDTSDTTEPKTKKSKV